MWVCMCFYLFATLISFTSWQSNAIRVLREKSCAVFLLGAERFLFDLISLQNQVGSLSVEWLI